MGWDKGGCGLQGQHPVKIKFKASLFLIRAEGAITCFWPTHILPTKTLSRFPWTLLVYKYVFFHRGSSDDLWNTNFHNYVLNKRKVNEWKSGTRLQFLEPPFFRWGYGFREAWIPLPWARPHHPGIWGWLVPGRRPHWTVTCLLTPADLSLDSPFSLITFKSYFAFCPIPSRSSECNAPPLCENLYFNKELLNTQRLSSAE